MTWEYGEAVITGDEMEAAMTESSQAYLKLFSDRGVPIGTDHFVEQEVMRHNGKVTYTFKWMKKGE
jgi:hypothetical protein